jgi:hypothetical protein
MSERPGNGPLVRSISIDRASDTRRGQWLAK